METLGLVIAFFVVASGLRVAMYDCIKSGSPNIGIAAFVLSAVAERRAGARARLFVATQYAYGVGEVLQTKVQFALHWDEFPVGAKVLWLGKGDGGGVEG